MIIDDPMQLVEDVDTHYSFYLQSEIDLLMSCILVDTAYYKVLKLNLML